jgi:3-hydroxyacyl-CoA dehydrogenase
LIAIEHSYRYRVGPTAGHRIQNVLFVLAAGMYRGEPGNGGVGNRPPPLNKEQPGYLLNSLLIPVLHAALALVVSAVADVHTIDKAWMIAMEVKRGPFAIIDSVGITTAYNINKNEAATTGDPTTNKIVEYLKANFVDTGKLGVSVGEGFYKYPDPEYLRPEFVK